MVDIINWKFVDGRTYYNWRDAWWEVEFFGPAPNLYRHV